MIKKSLENFLKIRLKSADFVTAMKMIEEFEDEIISRYDDGE